MSLENQENKTLGILPVIHSNFAAFFKVIQSVPISFLIPVGIFVFWIFSDYPRSLIGYDSSSFIFHMLMRPPIYPMFIDVFLPASVKAAGQPALGQNDAYLGVILAQKALLGISFGVLAYFLRRRFFAAPWMLVITGMLLPKYFLDLQSGDGFFVLSSAIMSEGLVYPWFFVLLAMTLACCIKPTTNGLVALGIWSYLGIEIAPRVLPFAAFSVAPIITQALIRIRSKEKFAFRSAIALFLFLSLFCLRSLQGYAKYGVFSNVPFNGWASIGIGLQFAEKNDYLLFEDPKLREYARLCLNDPLLHSKDPDFANLNIYNIAGRVIFDVYPGVPYIEANRINAALAKTLLSQPSNRARWLSWLYAETIEFITRPDRLISIFFLASFGLTCVSIFLFSHPFQALLFLAPLVHLFNILFTSAFGGINGRYVFTSSVLVFLLPTVFFLMIAEKLHSKFRNQLWSPRTKS